MRVYQQLLAANFVEGLDLETHYKWLPPVRKNMVKSQLTGTVVLNLAWFYILGISIPLLIGAFSIANYLLSRNIVVIVLGDLGLTLFLILIINSVVKKIDEEALKKYYKNKKKIITGIVKNLHFVVGFFYLVSSGIYIMLQLLNSYVIEDKLQTKILTSNNDYLAPDHSEIRLLSRLKSGSMAHCILPAGETSLAVKHKSVEEIWYVMEGEGSLWRKNEKYESVISLKEGTSLTIPPQTDFQFRNDGNTPLKIVIVTIPAWPGKQEAQYVEGYWKTNEE